MTIQLNQYPAFTTIDEASGWANYKTHCVYVCERYEVDGSVGRSLSDLYVVATSEQEAREIAEKTCDCVSRVEVV